MKKSMKIFAAAFALCLTFALGANVDAAETKLKEEIAVNEAAAAVTPMVSDISKANFLTGSYSTQVSSSNTIRVVGIAPADADRVEIGVFDTNGNLIARNEAYVSRYSNYQFNGYVQGIPKNKVVMIRVRAMQRIAYTSTYTYGNWSEPRASVFLKMKAKEYENFRSGYESLLVKTKKIKGIKKYKIQISKKRDTGYKTVKTIKAGKSLKVAKYKGKGLRVGRTWYIRVIPILNSKVPSDLYAKFFI
mgnify:CR=1 FL=1